MLRKVFELFRLDKSLEEKKKQLAEIEVKINNMERLIEETIAPVRLAGEERAIQLIRAANEEATVIVESAKQDIVAVLSEKEKLTNENKQLEESNLKLTKEISKQEKTARKFKADVLGVQRLIEQFPNAVDFNAIGEQIKLLESAMNDGEVLDTIVHLNLHYKDSKALRAEMNANNKDIRNLLESYRSRYTTKANATIYELMVIGLQAELQNILYTLSYSNLDKAIENSKTLINKYLGICANGNANILPTVTRFLTELAPLFEMAIRIEFKYYVQKELEKEEQRKIREIMRQEAEEKRLLEEERKKIEKEEEKYIQEIERNKALLATETDTSKIAALEARLKELKEQVEKLEDAKEEIIKRANGKAGYVYVISNLGSFGEQMFKVGMTRRLDPMDRVEELGDASVPFKFDVHALVFSDDAVGLEQKLHTVLEKQRVNKINLRKEFFYATVDGLQQIVQEIDPTVEFIKTMTAAEYRQSLSFEEEETLSA
ncbi:GIY-YIG nuclease family protein [Paenibacillus aurantiacus]|uniref:GIY-YIG nuclease family protein n=1 Tax=Paenibacillus aurantiacus TaxID=1936118 RepID=A0ABV5L0B9_9BACL